MHQAYTCNECRLPGITSATYTTVLTLLSSGIKYRCESFDLICFPQGILENAIKITNEPPTGMHANLHAALDNFDQVSVYCLLCAGSAY